MTAIRLKPYLAILSSRFRTILQYRAAAIAGIGTNLFFGIVRMMIFDAFYRSSSAPQPMSAEQVNSYIWLGQAMLMLVLIHVEPEVAAMIRSGSVAYEMTRPLDVYTLWFSRSFSGRAAPLSMRGAPIVVVAILFFGLRFPASLQAGLLFLVSTAAALILSAAIVTVLTISLLWSMEGDGVSRFASVLVFFFSGIGVPLPLFPDWIQGLVAVLPFRALLDTPFRIYMGHLSGTAAFLGLVHQLAWIGVIVVAGRMILARGLRRLVVQGG